MILYPSHTVVPRMFTIEQCESIIEKGKGLLAETANTNAVTFGGEQTQVRDSQVVFFDDDEIYKTTWEHVQRVNWDNNWNVDVDHTEMLQFTQYDASPRDENNKGQFYDWHQDHSAQSRKYALFNSDNPDHWRFGVVRDENGAVIMHDTENLPRLNPGYTHNSKFDGKIRKLSISICLADQKNFRGGEFWIDGGLGEQMKIDKHSVVLTQGSAIIFPSYLWHCVKPVTRGTRYSLILWLLGAKWR